VFPPEAGVGMRALSPSPGPLSLEGAQPCHGEADRGSRGCCLLSEVHMKTEEGKSMARRHSSGRRAVLSRDLGAIEGSGPSSNPTIGEGS